MLERLEVYNFKSYKGHQVIGPFKPFSCIIGPNGAGKSNLMDAISFVLGVRSAQLRSNQLKDLIYRAGTRHEDGENGNGADEMIVDGKGRRRNGAVDDDDEGQARKAWVMAVYVDKEDKEWKYQRIISAAGQSEYRLNGKTVKADAYNATLEKQNILVKARNFLVFQGDVEAVASQSPKDLTKLIEQISGSLDLRAEYEEAKLIQDRAVEVSTQNFNKRRGINSEIKQFKEQKSEAERFANLRTEHEAAIVHHLLWKLYHAQNSIKEQREKVDEIEQGLGQSREAIVKKEENLKTARKEVASAEKAFKKHEKKVKEAEKRLEEKRPFLLETDAEIKHISKKLKKVQDVIDVVERERTDKSGNVVSLEAELAKVEKAAQKYYEEMRRKSAVSAAVSGLTLSEDDLHEYNRLKGSSSRKAVKERADLEDCERSLKTDTSDLNGLKDKAEQACFKLDKAKTEEASLDERNATMQEKVKSVTSDLQRTKRELAESQAEKNRINQATTELNEKLENVYRKLQALDADKRETHREKALKDTIAKLQELFTPQCVHGRVADLCKPQQRKYDTAVTVVLGRNLDSIVVDTQRTALDCMDFMKRNRAGVATFIPLDTITPKPINDKFRNYARGARLALDVIDFDVAVERAMLFSCGNALVCDSLEVARHVAYDKGQEVKAVTLDGTLINKAGLMTGGTDSRGVGRKWDETEARTLTQQRERYHAQLQELNKTRPKQGSDERLISQITAMETELVGLKDDLSATGNRLRGVRSEIEVLTKQVKELEKKTQSITAKISEASGRADDIRRTVAREEDAVFADFCKRIGVKDIRVYESRQLKDAQAEGEERLRLDRQIARLKNQRDFEAEHLQTVVERVEILSKTVIKEESDLKEATEKKKAIEEELGGLSAQVDTVKEALAEYEATLVEKQAAVEVAKKAEAKAKKAIDGALKEMASLNTSIEKLASQRMDIYKRCKLEEINLPFEVGSLNDVPDEENLDDMAMDVDEEDAGNLTQKPRAVDDYGVELDYEELDEEEREDSSEEQEKKLIARISSLQLDIDKLSPNMKAFDKLGEVEAKLADTTAEFDRARQEAKEAKERFSDLQRRRTNLFKTAFDHISNNIDKVYKELTKGKAAPMGGVAYLALEDTDEPYLHGVKYNAMPPMKRFRDMEQLSGGEKTMAALALLFAIHSYHPSPFFVLDEVDAALDNTNVGRIAHYIRSKACRDFQFVIISLKNSLWDEANGIVGIWRDVDDRSSKGLTLDLDKYDDAPQ